MAAVDFFLKLDGIDGDATNVGHEKWIEILNFNWGVTNPASIGTGGGGAGAGKPSPSDFTLSLPFSSASPELFKKAVTGVAIATGTLSVSRFVKDRSTDFIKWNLSDIHISSYQTEGAEDGDFDQVALNFAKIEVVFTPQNPDGSIGTPISEGFDFQFFKAF